MKKLSIIVPAFNVESTILRALESISKQNVNDMEIIVIDDGSTDSTGKLVDDYACKDERICVYHTSNQGVTKARLTGVRKCAGEWIGFVDGDDVVDPDMYRRLILNAEKYGTDISHCGYQMDFSDGRVHYFYNTGIIEIHDNLTALRELLSGRIIEPGLCNKIFRNELFDEMISTDVIPEDIKINEDLLMNYYLFSKSIKSVYDDWCPYHYIVREGSTTRSRINRNKIYDPIYVKEIILNTCASEISKEALVAYINTCINVYNSLLISDYSDKETALEDIWDRIRILESSVSSLGIKRMMMACMIMKHPKIYKMVYICYYKWIQQSPYS